MTGYLVFVTTSTAILALFSLGLNLQWGFTGLVNFGHVGFMILGAYATVLLSLQGVPLVLATGAGVLLGVLLALVMGLTTLRLREDYLAIVTLGIAETLRLVVLNEQWLTQGSFGVQGFALPFAGEDYKLLLMWLCLGVLGVVFWGLERLVRSPWGRVLKAIREDEEVVKALGKNVFWYKLQALMLGGGIAALSGAFFAWQETSIYPEDFQPQQTFDAWTVVILGGGGKNLGTVLGAVIFWAYTSLTRFVLPNLVPLDDARLGALRIMIIGLLIMVLIRWRPQGILGKKGELTLGK